MKQTVSRERMIFRDPVTGEKSYQWADKITCRYDDLEKGPIIMEFLKGGSTVEEIVKKYHISLLKPFTPGLASIILNKNAYLCLT